MIQEQCDKCLRKARGECALPVTYDGTSCEQYIKYIDLEKHEKSVSSTLAYSDSEQNMEEQHVETETAQDITANYLKENTSIHGWLSFFLFSIVAGGLLSAILPLAQYSQSLAEYGSPFLVWVDLSLGLMLCVLSIYTLVAFCSRKPNAVFLGKTYVCTVFLSNFSALFGGDFESSGFGSLPQIIRSLIWGAIWFIYLCKSNQVQEIIPVTYRKKTAKDYYIVAALIIVPLVFMALGIDNIASTQEDTEQAFIQNTILKENEHTDGRIVLTCPNTFACEKQVVSEQNITIFILENEDIASVTICSDYDTDQSQKNFNKYWTGWEDSDAAQYPSSVVLNEQRTINGHSYYYKVVRYEFDNPVFWRFILMFDNASGKVCVISAYDGGYDIYMEELLTSIRFK